VRKLPLIPTLLVGLAVAAMIALGIWQLRRAEWKEALIARYEANAGLPPVAWPAFGAMSDEPLFRRSSVMCLEPIAWSVAGGANRAGEGGWRHIVDCRTGAEGPGVTIDIGWSKGFDVRPRWTGGPVEGMIAPRPDHRSLIATLLGAPKEPGMLLVADRPPPGLQPSAPPSPAEIPNNHRAYAVQWFLFAAVALVIYALALRRRGTRDERLD
jgi:cytochrome oxidase assembly protein ShyY1